MAKIHFIPGPVNMPGAAVLPVRDSAGANTSLRVDLEIQPLFDPARLTVDWFGMGRPGTVYNYVRLTKEQILYKFWDTGPINAWLENVAEETVIIEVRNDGYQIYFTHLESSTNFHTWFYAQQDKQRLKFKFKSHPEYDEFRKWVPLNIKCRQETNVGGSTWQGTYDIHFACEDVEEAALAKMRWADYLTA